MIKTDEVIVKPKADARLRKDGYDPNPRVYEVEETTGTKIAFIQRQTVYEPPELGGHPGGYRPRITVYATDGVTKLADFSHVGFEFGNFAVAKKAEAVGFERAIKWCDRKLGKSREQGEGETAIQT